MGATALVVGDLFLRRQTHSVAAHVYSNAAAPAMSLLGPVAVFPTTTTTGVTDSLGGSGHVAQLLNTLGYNVMLTGLVGNDAAGATVDTLLKQTSVAYNLSPGLQQTSMESSLLCNGTVVSRCRDAIPLLPNADTSQIVAALYALSSTVLAEIKVVVVVDLGYGQVTNDLLTTVRQFADLYGVKIVMMTEFNYFQAGRGLAHILITNSAGAAAETAANVHPALAVNAPDQLQEETRCWCLRKMHQSYSVVVVSDAESALLCTDPDNGHKGYTVQLSKAVQSTQERLTQATVMIAATQMETEDVVHSVTRAGQYIMAGESQQPVTRDVFDEYVYAQAGWASRLCDKHTAKLFVDRRRRLKPGCRIVFVTGAFTDISSQDIEAIRFASRQGDYVVVAIDDDATLVAAGAPVFAPESYRLTYVAILPWVHAVFATTEDTLNLVRHFKPEVLVPLGHTIATAGREIDYVAEHGGRVEFVPANPYIQ